MRSSGDPIQLSSTNRFELYLEMRGASDAAQKSNSGFKRQLSPLRYPGGKSRLIPYVAGRLSPQKTRLFVEPYAGGASVGLSLLDAGKVERLLLNDLDFGVYALFATIFSDPSSILHKLKTVIPTREMFFESQTRLTGGHQYLSIHDAAWDMLLVNRLAYAGIAKAHPLGGKNGSQDALLARWNPAALSKRIERLWHLRAFVEVSNRDALEIIEDNHRIKHATLFIDPPYVAKGPGLYPCSYTHNDHLDLCALLESLYASCPGADIQLFYDNDEFIKGIYSLPEVIEVGRKYCM